MLLLLCSGDVIEALHPDANMLPSMLLPSIESVHRLIGAQDCLNEESEVGQHPCELLVRHIAMLCVWLWQHVIRSLRDSPDCTLMRLGCAVSSSKGNRS